MVSHGGAGGLATRERVRASGHMSVAAGCLLRYRSTVSYATLTAPDWLAGNNAAQFFTDAGLHAVQDAGTPSLWRVCTREAYMRGRAELIGVQPIVEATGESNYTVLDSLAEDVPRTHRLSTTDVEERRERAKSGQLVDLVSYLQIMTAVTPLSDVRAVIEDFQGSLANFRITETEDRMFPAPANYLLTRSPVLLHRLRMPSLWLRLAHDERLARGDLEHMNAALAAGELLFASGEALSDGVYVLDAYIGPLLASVAPSVWGFTSARASGTYLFSFGRAIAGTTGDAAELLQALPSQMRTTSQTATDLVGIPVPHLTTNAIKAALGWWCARINDLFAVLSDPACFTDSSGLYAPEHQMQVLMSVEQLFRRTTAALLSHRDVNARRVLLFSVLDTLERLTAKDFVWHCRSANAHTTLERLRSRVPAEAAPLLLSAAERAVEALDGVPDGFFIVRQTGAAGIAYADGAKMKTLNLEEGAALYLKALRDATHGHGAHRLSAVPRTNALLAHHDGAVSHDLGLLSYLYLLDFVTNPDLFRRILGRP
jgi:hypothetical protein